MQEGEKTGRGGVTEAPVELKTEYIHYLGSSSLWNMILNFYYFFYYILQVLTW